MLHHVSSKTPNRTQSPMVFASQKCLSSTDVASWLGQWEVSTESCGLESRYDSIRVSALRKHFEIEHHNTVKGTQESESGASVFRGRGLDLRTLYIISVSDRTECGLWSAVF